ncbi:CU044_5270 family protein [Phytohabitans sp. LJ34]|uniref:CU044_5270 family protein n=1 Tax=Phytohabitans sp. LJ34 TaxID=3452217 RepID=UPI003F89524F
MFDTSSTKALLGPTDPARGVRIPPPRAQAADIIALAEATAAIVAPSGVRRRRILVPVAAGVAAAGLVATGLVASGLTGADPSSVTAGETTGPTPTRTVVPTPTLGPVIRPVGFQIDQRPPAAGDQLRALAAQLAPGRCDTTTGKYTFVHTIGWNAVFDDLPNGKAQRIIPSERREWSAPDGSARIRTTVLPTVYPNEESYRYFQRHPVEPTATHTTVEDVDAPPAAERDRAKPPLPTDPAEIAKRIDDQNPFRTVRDWSSNYPVPLATRAELLRILAKTPGVVWRGEATDRAGRKGVAVSLDNGEIENVLIFDPRTAEMLAWDEIEQPTDTVAGATLVLGCEHTDQFG